MTFRTAVGKTLVAVIAGCVVVASSSAWAQDRHDTRIANEIGRQIDGYPQYSIFDHIGGVVEDGVVTLTGKVTMPYKKDDIGKRVGGISGVKDVKNQIEVLSVSTYDEDLRLRIARAIYGNSAFWRYGARANPPIHIIVDLSLIHI